MNSFPDYYGKNVPIIQYVVYCRSVIGVYKKNSEFKLTFSRSLSILLSSENKCNKLKTSSNEIVLNGF